MVFIQINPTNREGRELDVGTRFEKDYEIHYYEVDARLNCTIESIMNFFCDIGTKQSELLGVGIGPLTELKMAWVFYKYDIKVKRYPVYGEKIKVVTEPVGFKKFYASREYYIYDENNEVIVTGEGIFLLIDIERRRAIRIPDDQYGIYGVTDETNKDITITKLPKLTEPMYSKEFKIRYSDIDSNKHVNNVKYVQWAIESIPLEVILQYQLKELNVVFEKECSYGGEIRALSEIKSKDENIVEIYHKVEDLEGKGLTSLVTKWERI